MLLQDYISVLEGILINYDSYIYTILKGKENYVLAIPKRRLYDRGTDANDKLIQPKYSRPTISFKRKKGKRVSHVTLRDTGQLYRSFRLYRSGGAISFSVPNNEITTFLTQHYSSNELFGFSRTDELKIFELFIKPEIEKIIYPQTDIDIDI